jgi:hypothetical protein
MPAGKKDIYKYGEKYQFSHDNQPENRGRKPRIWIKWAKENNLSRADAEAMIRNLLSMTIPELQAVVKRSIIPGITEKTNEELSELITGQKERTPSAVITAAKTILESTKRCQPSDLAQIMDAAFGRQTAKIDITGIPSEAAAALKRFLDAKLLSEDSHE